MQRKAMHKDIINKKDGKGRKEGKCIQCRDAKSESWLWM